jgi:hypothetical protein
MLLDLYSLIYIESSPGEIAGTATAISSSAPSGTIEAGAVTIAGTATAITSSAPTGTVALSYTIAANRPRRISSKTNFFLVDWRNPAGWTDAQKARPCARASISPHWTTSPFSYLGVECFPGIQPTIFVDWPSLTPYAGFAPGSYLYDLADALISEDPDYVKLNGYTYAVWLEGMYPYTPPPGGPTYGVIAIDIRIPRVREIWTEQLVSHFGSWCKGIHHDYLTNLSFLDGYEFTEDFTNPSFYNEWLDPPTNSIPNPDYDPTIWPDWDTGYLDQLARERVAWPSVVLMGQQWQQTDLTDVCDGVFLEENISHWEPHYPARVTTLKTWLNSTGQGQDTLVDNMKPYEYPGNLADIQNATYEVARDIGGYVGWNRDSVSGTNDAPPGYAGTPSMGSGDYFRYYNGTITAGPVTISGDANLVSLSSPTGTLGAGSVTFSGDANQVALSSPNGAITAGAVTVSGSANSTALSSPDGSISTATIISGDASPITSSSPDGSVTGSITIPGDSDQIALSSPSGSLTAGAVTVSGSASSVALSSPDGSISTAQIISGEASSVVLSSPAGSTSAGTATISGDTTPAALSSPAGSLSAGSITIGGETCVSAFSAPTGGLSAGSVSISGSAQTVVLGAPDGSMVMGDNITGAQTVVIFSSPDGSTSAGTAEISGQPGTITLTSVNGVLTLVSPNPIVARATVTLLMLNNEEGSASISYVASGVGVIRATRAGASVIKKSHSGSANVTRSVSSDVHLEAQ